MEERGVEVHHTMIYRWIQSYAPQLEKLIRWYKRLTGCSWRADETYILEWSAACDIRTTEPAAIVGGLYYGFAGLGHIGQTNNNAKEYMAMISDGFIFLVLSAFLSSKLL
jgi:hypothetical protein